MSEKSIKQIQNRIIKLLKQKNKPLYLLAKNNCSELSRLVGCWILEKNPNLKISVVKGENVMNIKNKCHDVLLIEYNNQIYLIDPTIWQFFKNKRNILIKKEIKNIRTALITLQDIYRGNWKISEKIRKKKWEQKNEWKKVIKQNIKEL